MGLALTAIREEFVEQSGDEKVRDLRPEVPVVMPPVMLRVLPEPIA